MTTGIVVDWWHVKQHKDNVERVTDFVVRGDLMLVDGVYRITVRGYRFMARFFYMWLRDNDCLPPFCFELLSLDGCLDTEIDKCMWAKYNFRRWQSLRRVIIDNTLSADEVTKLRLVAKTNKGKVTVPVWCSGLIEELLKDTGDRSQGLNRLADADWGRGERCK